MNTIAWALIVFAGVGVVVWLISFAVEALRPAPKAPVKLRWAPNIPIDSVEVDGNRLRYIKTGKGPILVLLHTLRTQLDLFEKLVPELAKHFTVYALDYPGHGYSDIPRPATTRHSLLTRSKAFSKNSTFAMSPSQGSRLEALSR